MMSKEDNKKDDQLIRLDLITAVISLLDKLIELIIKIIDIVRAKPYYIIIILIKHKYER